MLINRELGEVLPVSIGTALAFESIINPDTYSGGSIEPPEAVYLNLRTLVRNLAGSVEADISLGDEDYLCDLAEELFILNSALNNNSLGTAIKLVVYCNDYSSLRKMFPEAKLKEPKTEKQLEYKRFEDRMVNLIPNAILGEASDELVNSIMYGDVAVGGQDERAMLVSHLPVDLLSQYQFNRLHLVESHTGTVKGPSRWNSKLTGGKQNSRIPFNYFTVQVFGDNANHFLGWPISFKKKILELAKVQEWNATTTLEKIRTDLYILASVDKPSHDKLSKLLSNKPAL